MITFLSADGKRKDKDRLNLQLTTAAGRVEKKVVELYELERRLNGQQGTS